MNRRVILNVVLGMIFGVALASVGVLWYSWQYWMFMAIYLATVVNSIVPTRS